MFKDGNISNQKINESEFPSYSRKKKHSKPNYLTESSYEQIQKVLRKNYFNRLENISKNKQPNYIYDDEIKEVNKNIDEFNERPTKYAAKQIILSNRIRKDNYNRFKKRPKNIIYNSSLPNLSNQIMINSNKEDYKTLMDENNNRKSPLPVIKKVFKDNSPLYYDLNYIDEVEKKYIKPFLSNNNIKYRDYIENKKSKAPFNFIIG